ncbi:MAG: rhodanese-like domain-containing protein [Anaerolineae bacterium]|jgi:rhodanese-related sulfurtransferase|nr:rhodanese-like domain-containing protein [Anaerolineae bacterium]
MFFLKADGRTSSLRPAEYLKRFSARAVPHTLLDVRSSEEFEESHIIGAVNIPVQSLMSRLSEIPRNQPVIVYCRSGSRSTIATRILSDAGYGEVYDLGSFMVWVAQNNPIRRGITR